MKKLFVSLVPVLLAALLAGCASDVKLDTPVEDKAGTAVGQGGAATGPVGVGGVTSVDLGRAGDLGTGPANVGKVVYFDYDSYQVKSEFTSVIDAHARYLTGKKSQRVMVEGHTDSSGGREYNLALGQRRAEAVRRSLTLLGVPDSQIEAVSFGKEKPAAFGSDENSMARNRRAEINYRSN